MTCTISRIPLYWWIACVLSLLSGALPGNDIAGKDGNWSSVSPSGCQLTTTSLGTRAICTRLGLRSVPQDLPSNTTLLDLSINLITTLYDESFTYLPDIITLALRRNQLSVIEEGAFGHLGNLKQLILERNRLMSLPAGLLSSNRLLSVLLLGRNKLSSIPTNALPLSDNINLFDLTNNNISFIKPSDFTPLQNYLARNNIIDIEKSTTITFPFLEYLDLSFNRITEIKKSLVRLDLSGNYLDMLAPGTFNPLKRLEILLLSHSSIKVLIPSVFHSLTSLTKLDLRDNEISALPGDLFQSQSRLVVFYITNNRLDSIPKTLFNRSQSLHHLFMQRNRITTIEPGTIFPTNRTTRIDASGNPFSCTCDLSWFVEWLRSGNVELIHPDDTLCSLSSIKDMVQSPILSFHPDQYCGINILIITGVSFSVVLVAILCLVAYRKRWWLNYKLFLLKLAIFGYEEINQDFDAQDYEYQLNLMYDEDDQEWVDQIIKPVLQERFPHLQKVAFGDNNLNIEMYYIPALHYVVENSFKTVLLISNNSVDEAWFLTKLRIALEHLNDTRLDKVILIFLEDIQDDDLPYLVRLFMSKNKPYMLWTEDEDGQELFWAQFAKSMRANRVINSVIPV
ncbi:platelet glycoprotein V-like [Strongylocentrotus purpuratus]|uniref:TIR domain-containing protein n=1 Tax=Strongylocentrotus purpuratus TaxID=7668 RepID=A0A7M7PLP5_STRPU|nr:platelet glycoprotein V-like [Strongylocentrotus purpuratus]